MERLTDEHLEEIRKRAEAAKSTSWQTRQSAADIFEDVPKLLAEIQRLKGIVAFYRHAAKKHATTSYVNKKEMERLRKLAHEILEGYDAAERRVIDEISTNRNFSLSFHEKVLESYQNEINGVDIDGANI